MSKTLKKIDTYAFDNSGISSAEVPDTCYWIGDYAFSNCKNLKTVTIGTGIKRLPPYMLAYSQVSKFNIPSGVKFIHTNAFSGAPKLDVTLDEKNPYFVAKDQDIYSKATNTLICTYGALPELYKIPDGIEVISKGTLQTNMETVQTPTGSFYTGVSAARLVIPDSMKIIDTTSIWPMFTTCYNGKYFLFNGATVHGYAGDAYFNPTLFGANIEKGECTDGELPPEYQWIARLGARSNKGLVIVLVILVILFIALVCVYLFFPIKQSYDSIPDRSVQNETLNLV